VLRLLGGLFGGSLLGHLLSLSLLSSFLGDLFGGSLLGRLLSGSLFDCFNLGMSLLSHLLVVVVAFTVSRLLTMLLEISLLRFLSSGVLLGVSSFLCFLSSGVLLGVSSLLSFLSIGVFLGESSLGLCGTSFSFSKFDLHGLGFGRSSELVVLLDSSFPPGFISLEDGTLGASRSLTVHEASNRVLAPLGTVVFGGLVGIVSSLLERFSLQLNSLNGLGVLGGRFSSFNYTLTSASVSPGLLVVLGGSKDASSAGLVEMVILIASSSPGRSIVHFRYLVAFLNQFGLLGSIENAVSLLLKFLEGDSICPSS